jgi:hypothetical protein
MKLSNVRVGALAVLLAFCFAALGAGSALAVQGHMLNARSYLNSALGQLNMATPDKAGHRVNAMNLVRDAIRQVNLGIQAGAR